MATMMQQRVIDEGFLSTGGGQGPRSGVLPSPPRAELDAGGLAAEWRTGPAVPETVRLARRSVVAFAELAGAGTTLLDRVKLAVSEAVTNVVLHAYRDRDAEAACAGPVHVGVALAGTGDRDELWVLVADEGCGLQPRDDSPGGGRGLRLIANAVDELTVVRRGAGGTELRMRFDLDRGTGEGPGRDGAVVADAARA
jgi:serine/threonine-protein kinase RsbW